MPHEKIEIPEPSWATPQTAEQAAAQAEASKLWIPQGLMVQWGPYGETDGAPAVGIGTGHFREPGDDRERKPEDMMMLWFNRSQVNHAIRTLRRARVAAYGADE